MSRSTVLTIVVLVVVTNFALDYMRVRGYTEPRMLVLVVGVGLVTGLIMRWLINWLKKEGNI